MTTITETTEETQTELTTEITRQFKEDIGESITQSFTLESFRLKRQSKLTTHKEEADYILRQKYGLLPPELTSSEMNLVRREERNVRRFGSSK